MTRDDAKPRIPQPAGTVPAARWLYAGPGDEVSRRLAARLGMVPETPEGSRFVPAGSGAGPVYAAAFAGAALAGDGPALDGRSAWDAVAYRPPRRAGSPAPPGPAAAAAL